jgi:hypothetical protein
MGQMGQNGTNGTTDKWTNKGQQTIRGLILSDGGDTRGTVNGDTGMGMGQMG